MSVTEETSIHRAGGRVRRFAARRPGLALVLCYTAVFALLMGVWAAIFAANGKSFIWYGDTLKQHYPALVYYGRWLRQAVQAVLTSGTVPLWDMSIGYGADVVTTLSYYVMGDPLDLLAALVPSRYGEELLETLIVLRVYLAGLAFLPFSLHHKNSRFGTLLGAVAYAFCGWTLQTALMEPLFIVPMYCFPLMLLGADYLFEKRSPVPFVAAVALTACSNFLFFYMAAALLVLYALVRYFRLYGRDLRQLGRTVAKFAAFGLMGTAIAAATLLPTALELFSSARTTLARQTTGYPFQQFWSILANLTTGAQVDGYSTYCGITAVAVLAVMILFCRTRRNTALKAAWLVLLAFMALPWAGRALNGFSYMQNRWVWAFALLEAFILARVCPDMTEFTGTEKLTLFALLAGYALLALWQRDVRTEWALAGFTLLLLLAVFVLSAGQTPLRARQAVLMAGCCLGVILNIGYRYGADENNAVQEYVPPGYAWQTSVEENPAIILKQLDDGRLWRYDSTIGNLPNTAMLTGLYGTGYFFSLNNGYLSQWMSEMGYNSPVEYSYEGLMGRSVLDLLVGVRYCVGATNNAAALPYGYNSEPVLAMDVGSVNVGAYQNDAALPIGYTCAARITRAEYDALSPAQRQDALLGGVLLEDDVKTALPAAPAVSEVVTPKVKRTQNGVELLEDGTYYAAQDGGTITFTIEQPVPDAENYLVAEGMEYTATNPYEALPDEEKAALSPAERLEKQKQYAHFWCKEQVYLRLESNLGAGIITYDMPNNQYYCGRHDFVYNFGRSDTGLTTLTVVLPYAGHYRFSRLEIQCQPLANTQARAGELGAEALENVTLGTNTLSGEVTVSQQKVLVVQTPYSKGWHVTVDGQNAELLRVNTAFLGVELAPGSHRVEFTYETPGLWAGIVLSAAGLLALAGTALLARRRSPAENGRRGKTILQAGKKAL